MDYDFEHPIVDPDEVLTTEQHGRLMWILYEHRRSTGIVPAIALTRTEPEEGFDALADGVFDEPRLGDADRRDGVLWLAATDDSAHHLQYDAGVRGAIPEEHRDGTRRGIQSRFDADRPGLAARFAVERIIDGTDDIEPSDELGASSTDDAPSDKAEPGDGDPAWPSIQWLIAATAVVAVPLVVWLAARNRSRPDL